MDENLEFLTRPPYSYTLVVLADSGTPEVQLYGPRTHFDDGADALFKRPTFTEAVAAAVEWAVPGRQQKAAGEASRMTGERR